MTEIPANAAPVTDHPELPTLPPVPTPQPPATWDDQQRAALESQAHTVTEWAPHPDTNYVDQTGDRQ